MQEMLQPPKQTSIRNCKIKLNQLIRISFNIIKKNLEIKYKIGFY